MNNELVELLGEIKKGCIEYSSDDSGHIDPLARELSGLIVCLVDFIHAEDAVRSRKEVH
jgi:hypothetical protein